MSKASDDLLAFKDYDDFADSPQISVNSPKKVIENGRPKSFNVSQNKICEKENLYCRIRTIHNAEGVNVSNRVLSAILQH